ncbi:uncharacterized protein F58A4.6 [Anthonomus grandis grandis]|uniref:uncharacterized protein F58A4.6 n=1 Tax=Anthonomus grandis grandis TaxID=2921223 RepID=UPI002165A087|nr:uncharacterized protein F58A4.6 [Anthonomus grandis grandis]
MEPHLLIACYPKYYKYDNLELGINHVKTLNLCNCGQKKQKRKSLSLDCVFVYYFVKELHISWFYRNRFIERIRSWGGPDVLVLVRTKKNLIDYNWNERIYQMVRERCEVDHAFSWLSTLGGAFSALGDYFGKCAEMAGKISLNQLKLALRIGDPSLQARCRLYLSISLIQKKRFNMASHIIKTVYHSAKSHSVKDERLLKMCKGIWAKLQYEYDIYRQNKTVNR